jgi:nicotinamide mononucleotide transporter
MSAIMFTVFTVWGYEVSFLELISVITSLVGVVLGVFGVRVTWPWWVGSSLLYGFFFFQVDLIASALLQFIFIAAGIWGWYGWGPKGAIPAKLKNKEKFIWLALLLISWVVLAPALANIGAAATWPDSFVLVGSTIAQILMVLE